MGKGYFKTIVVLLMLQLCSCSDVPISQDLDQIQANEIVALLHQSGIGAVSTKGRGGKGKFQVAVDATDYGAAVALITARGLPSDRKLSFAELVAPQGFIPNSREMEALRLDHAMALELEEMLQNDPRIASARVVVRQHFAGEDQNGGVSVSLQERTPGAVSGTEIKALVQQSVAGVKADQIFISIHPAPAPAGRFTVEGVSQQNGSIVRVPLVPFLVSRVPKDEYNYLALTMVGCIVLVAGVGAVLGFWVGASLRSKTAGEGERILTRGVRSERPRGQLPEQ